MHANSKTITWRHGISWLLLQDELRDAVLLVFANKQDLPNAMNAAEITDKLGLHSLRQRHWLFDHQVFYYFLYMIYFQFWICFFVFTGISKAPVLLPERGFMKDWIGSQTILLIRLVLFWFTCFGTKCSLKGCMCFSKLFSHLYSASTVPIWMQA